MTGRTNSFEDKDSRNESDQCLKDVGYTTKTTPNTPLSEPVIMSLPTPVTPVSDLDAAAVMIQKVYRSYLTRRNLADCAVVVKKLWWKPLDFPPLKQRTASFFYVEKSKSAVSLRPVTRLDNYWPSKKATDDEACRNAAGYLSDTKSISKQTVEEDGPVQQTTGTGP